MKKIFITLLLLIGIAQFSRATNTEYIVDDARVDQLIENATPIDLLKLLDNSENNSDASIQGTKNITTALVLGLLLGELGVHRLYLGTSSGTFLAYCLTGGGCGVLYVIDNLLLILAIIDNEPGDKYMDNPNLFMWM